MPPKNFLNSIGLTSPAAGILAQMNDEDDKTFLEIADYIEANL